MVWDQAKLWKLILCPDEPQKARIFRAFKPEPKAWLTMWDMHDSFLTTTQCVKKRWNKSVLFSSQYHSRCNRFRPPRGTEMSKIHIFLAKTFSRDPNKWDYVKKFNIDKQYLIKKWWRATSKTQKTAEMGKIKHRKKQWSSS